MNFLAFVNFELCALEVCHAYIESLNERRNIFKLVLAINRL